MSALSDQTEPDGILRELARTIWAKWHNDDECPPKRIPPQKHLVAWLGTTPQLFVDDAVVEFVRHMDELDDSVPVLTEWHTARSTKEPESARRVYIRWIHSVDDEGRCILTEATSGAEALLVALERKVETCGASVSVKALQRYWKATRQAGKKLRHPLSSLVAAWLQRPPVGIDTRRHQNIPGSLTKTHHVVVAPADDGQPHLPFDWDAQPAHLSPPADKPRFEVGYLPYIELASKLPTPVLDLLDFGASRGRNGPVPVPSRVGWELILLPEPGDWHAEQATVTATHAKLGRRVWPNTRRYQPEKHGPLLYEAARWLNNPDNATWWRRKETARPILVVTFFAPPFAPYHRADRIGAHVVLPDGGRKVGPQFDAHLRRILAATSYRQHRVYIAAVCLWDARATFKGHLVQLTVPVVERNPAGYVTGHNGKIATEKDGRPSRRATHPLAVHTGERMPNSSAAAAYPWLEGNDSILVAHHRLADTVKLRNLQRERSVQTLLDLRKQGTRKAQRDKVIVTRETVLDFEARYRSDGVLTGAQLADLPEKKRPPHAELEAVRLLPSLAHFAAYEARRERRAKARRGARAG